MENIYQIFPTGLLKNVYPPFLTNSTFVNIHIFRVKSPACVPWGVILVLYFLPNITIQYTSVFTTAALAVNCISIQLGWAAVECEIV